MSQLAVTGGGDSSFIRFLALTSFSLYRRLAGAPQDFLALDKSISPELSSLYNNLIQFPLIGQAQVITYNIPELSPSDPHMVCITIDAIYLLLYTYMLRLNSPQILDRETLALIQVRAALWGGGADSYIVLRD